MSIQRFRPNDNCLYVVTEPHGNIENLKNLLYRILPLRKYSGNNDKIVFMGDYIDGEDEGPEVLDYLCEVKQMHPDRIFFLRGNHDAMMQEAFDSQENYDNWINLGGYITAERYINSANLHMNPRSLSYSRLYDIVPKEHQEFLKSLVNYVQIDNYFFCHAGFDYKKPIKENNEYNFIYDNSSRNYVKNCILTNKIPEFKDDLIFVTSHSYDKKPILHSKYFMLGGTRSKRIFCFELISMEAVSIKKNKKQIYPYNFKYYD